MKNDITILLTTCDAYADAWDPFFALWKKYWPDCAYPFVVNSETKTCETDLFSVRTVYGGKGLTWSKRLKRCLNTLDSEFVLLCLEDYFLQSPVNTEIFCAALHTMEEDRNVGVIQFAIDIDTKYDPNTEINTYFSPVPKYKKDFDNGRVFCVLSLYRTSYLKKLLLPQESPWEFERFGSLRSQFLKEKVYRENGNHPRCFVYFIEPIYGYAISRGKWLPNNQKQFAENGIEVDYSTLGVMTPEEYETHMQYYYHGTPKKTQKEHHTLSQKIMLPLIHPVEFIRIIVNLIKKRIKSFKIKMKLCFPFFPI